MMYKLKHAYIDRQTQSHIEPSDTFTVLHIADDIIWVQKDVYKGSFPLPIEVFKLFAYEVKENGVAL